MQSMIMNDDDKRWYARLFSKNARDFLKTKKPLNVPRTRYIESRAVDTYNIMHDRDRNHCLGCAVLLCTEAKHSNTEDLLMEPDDTNVKKGRRKRQEEVSTVGGGSIRGSQSRAERRRIKKAAKSFGGGAPIET